MAMMEKIRQGTQSPFMKLVFGAIVLVFVFWGVGAQGPTSQEIAKVNGHRISDTDMQRRVRNVVRGMGSSLDEDQLLDLQREVIAALIQERVILQEAEVAGLEVDGEEIARAVLSYPAFKDADGRFNKSYYERILKREGLNEARFENLQRDEITRSKLEGLAAGAIRVSDTEVARVYALQPTTLEVAWLLISDGALAANMKLSDEEVNAHLADKGADVQAAYDKDLDSRYRHPRRATLSTILVNAGDDGSEGAEATLRALVAGLQSQADFAAAAGEHSDGLSSVNGGELGTLAEPMMDASVAEVVFATAAGAMSAVVVDDDGAQVFWVHDIIDARETPFDEVKASIARGQLADAQVEAHGDALAEQILARWKAEGSAPDDLMLEHGLVTRQAGPFPVAAPNLGAPISSPGLMDALGQAKEPGVLDSVFDADGGRVLAHIITVNQPDPVAYGAQKGFIESQLLAAKRAAFVAAWERDLVARARVQQRYIP